MSERIVIGPQVRKLRKQVDNCKVVIDVDGPIPGEHETDATKAMELLRPELYEKAALLAPFAVSHVVVNIAPGSLSGDDVQDTTELYEKVFTATSECVEDFSITDVPANYTPTAARLEKLLERAYEIGSNDRYESFSAFFTAGVHTAEETAFAGLTAIDALRRPYPHFDNPKAFSGLALRSHRLSTEIMHVNIDSTDAVRRATRASRGVGDLDLITTAPCINPNLLHFTPSPDDPDCLIDYWQKPTSMIDPRSLQPIDSEPTRFATIGCPAAFSHAAQDLYAWNVAAYSHYRFGVSK